MTREAILAQARRQFSDRLATAIRQASESGRLRTDAASWAVTAFWRDSDLRELLKSPSDQLRREQLPDGSVPIDPRFPLAAWPTPLALLAWLQQEGNTDNASKAVDFLLAWQGLHWINRETEVVGHDTSLVGWPWVTGAHSWIEPTVLVLMALGAAGKQNHPRCDQGRTMILNRQLPSGGWNFGNTTVYGRELRPMLHSTGMALAALSKTAGPETVANSVQYLEREIESVRSPLSLGWGIIGLSAWNRRPGQAEQWIAECIEREQETTEYDLTLLCLLQCALLPADQNPLLQLKNS